MSTKKSRPAAKDNDQEVIEIEIPTSGPSNAGNPNPANKSTMNSANRPPIEPVYQLEWKVRDQIMANLNLYTRLLCAKPDPAEAEEIKEQLLRDNLDLYPTLISLPLKSSLPAGRSNELVLDFDLSTKLQVIHSLAANHSLVFDCASPAEESQKKISEQNNDLIVRLIKLPFVVRQSTSTGSADASASNGKSV